MKTEKELWAIADMDSDDFASSTQNYFQGIKKGIQLADQFTPKEEERQIDDKEIYNYLKKFADDMEKSKSTLQDEKIRRFYTEIFMNRYFAPSLKQTDNKEENGK